MAMFPKTSSAIIGFGIREGTATLVDAVLGRPSRPRRVLDYIRSKTNPGDPVAVLEAMDTFALEQRFLMNVGDVKGMILTRQLMRSAAGNVLELGTYCGYSAILMGQHLAGNGHVDSVEVQADNAAVAREIIEHAGLTDVITVHVGSAESVIPQLGKQYQLVFIDHLKNLYLQDLKVIESCKAIGPGSIVVADNIGMFDATGYLDHVRKCGRYQNTHYDTHMEYSDNIYDAIEVSVMTP